MFPESTRNATLDMKAVFVNLSKAIEDGDKDTATKLISSGADLLKDRALVLRELRGTLVIDKDDVTDEDREKYRHFIEMAEHCS